jgi:hypothetical protein
VAFSSPYHPASNALIERQNKTFIEALRSFVNAQQDDWDEALPCYELAYNNSVNPSTGDTPFFLNHGRHARIPAALLHCSQSPAVDDFVQTLTNRIAAARDHIIHSQGNSADQRARHHQPATFQAGDLVLLNTEHYNLALPSAKLSPKWIGPLKVLEVRGPNTVRIEVPPRLRQIVPIQNVEHLKPYIQRDPETGPVILHEPPQLVDSHEEFEVEAILAHRNKGNRTQYLVRFASYGPEDDLWLPARNLKNAPEVLQAYLDRQEEQISTPHGGQRALRRCIRIGHEWHRTSLPEPHMEGNASETVL